MAGKTDVFVGGGVKPNRVLGAVSKNIEVFTHVGNVTDHVHGFAFFPGLREVDNGITGDFRESFIGSCHYTIILFGIFNDPYAVVGQSPFLVI